MAEDSEGNLWFSTYEGITKHIPDKTPPRVSITKVIADKEYPSTEHIKLSSTINRITFVYQGSDFRTRPGQMWYLYKMDGVDDDWQKPTRKEQVDYRSLKPGQYQFYVKAVDRDLNYSKPASITLNVVPPFYLRAIFLAPTIGLGVILLATLIILATGFVKHRRQIRAYERLAVEELQDANQMQMSLMPDAAPPIEGLEIAGKCLPANTVSGDFFDYLEGKNEIGLVVADVTGKAMKGAMNAVMADGVLRMAAKAQKKLSPASLMAELNDVLKNSMEWGMNITMVIGNIDTDTEKLTIANAAHHAHPLLLRNGEVRTLKAGGMPLGMRAGIEYSEEQFPLENGDVIIFMTDGIIEAQDSEDKMYSDSKRLEETIRKFTNEMSAESMVDAIITDAIDFGGGKAQRDDDMTVVVAKIR